jgi:UDP-glucose 4-epimerase
MKYLITGGAGYIGSTIASALIDAGHTPIILDSLVRGREEFTRGRIFYKMDIGDRAGLEQIFREHPDIQATVHCAALIIVPESTAMPYEYYRENVSKSVEMFHTLHDLGYPRVVFSSSASVYATPKDGYMVREDAPLNPLSPYARTKYMMEMVLKDFCDAYDMRGIALRYFNPIGADPQMRTGLPTKEPSLVVGRMVEVAMGRIPEFHVTGTTWPTRDGTGIRDYIHVWDLARAHVMALTNFDQAFERTGNPDQRYLVINLGSGNGVTVRELVNAFENVLGREIPKKDMPARPGDVAGAYANDDKARTLLGWQPEMSVEQCIADAIKWGEKRKEVLGY